MASKEPQGCRRYVDMWALPGIHPSNVEFLQKLKTADTNHFTTHMDCVGTVSEMDQESGDWSQTHLIGLRTDVWKPDGEEMESALGAIQDKRRSELKRSIKRHGRLSAKQKQQLDEQLAADEVMKMQSGEIETRRLVLKLFKTTTERTRWLGTIEEITTAEVHNSIGSNRTLLTLAVMLPRNQMVTYIQQNHRTFRIPAVFTFCFHDGARMWNLLLKRYWFSIGADFEIEADGEAIGEIDGRLFSFGCDSYVEIDPHPLAEHGPLVDLLTLFAASVGYHKAMRRSVGRRVEAALSGESHRNVIGGDELRLRNNGRAAA
ncbi:hypothetical protein [Stieleria varia]|uniref:Uncharacterized protein n=1 Tax=Stieleria varia TaxID=2528005 RepID=A0A5C6B398_9BACT|nr:hypothetical protein [Stieleria varia]TWU05931.1 hypothetical protein Pla52n_16470 [Stieleria varia]